MRLIDADAYLGKVCTYNETGCGSCKLQTKCPADEPTIDAVPVRHGKWIEQWKTADTRMLRCSECKMVFNVGNGREGNYCPNCGAKMYETEKKPCDDCQEFDCYGCEYAEREEEE